MQNLFDHLQAVAISWLHVDDDQRGMAESRPPAKQKFKQQVAGAKSKQRQAFNRPQHSRPFPAVAFRQRLVLVHKYIPA